MTEAQNRAEVGKTFFEVHKLIGRHMRKSFEEDGLTMPQGMMIGMLMKHGEMKITELSEKSNLSSSTISGIVDRLEKLQLVVRRRSEQDRRIVYVKLTGKVEEMYREKSQRIERAFEEMLSEATNEETENILTGLSVFKKVLQDHIRQDSNSQEGK